MKSKIFNVIVINEDKNISDMFYGFYYANYIKPTLTWKSYNRTFSHKIASDGYHFPHQHRIRLELKKW